MARTSILVIEPQGSNRETLINLLNSMDFKVDATDELEEALSKTDNNPDLIILNEEVNGLTPDRFLDELEKMDHDAFLIVTSTNPDLNKGNNWLTNGAFAYLSHPVTLEALEPVIEKGLENKEAYYQVVTMARDLKSANAALEREKAALKEKSEDLRFLYDLGYELSSTLVSREVVRIVSDALSRIISADMTIFMIAFNPKNELILYPNRPLRPALTGSIAEDLIRELDNNGNHYYSSKYVVIDPANNDAPLSRKPRRKVILPLTVAGHSCGVMGLYFFRPAKIDPDKRMLLESVAMQSAQALYNAYQHEQALKMASHDPLTGLLNRRAFDENLNREFERYLRYGVNLSLIMIDLDHFKSVNDRFGHKAGDIVLQAVAGVIRESVRATDITARLGGEEFAVILPETDQEHAQRLAGRIQARLQTSTIPLDDVNLKQTVSLGVADTQELLPRDPDDLIHIADQAMYLAKKEGRNTIRLATDIIRDNSRKEKAYAC